MAWNFNGGTDKVYWTVSAAPPDVGCISFWMRSTQTTLNTTLLTHWGSTSRQGFGIILNSGTAGKIQAAGYAATTQRVALASTSSVNDGNPHYVALNLNRIGGGSNQLYIDGAQEAAASASGNWTTGGVGGFFVEAGKNSDSFWSAYVGDLWEIGYWNAQLDASEIAALAKGYAPKLIRPSALIGYMPLVRDLHEIRSGYPVNASSGSVTAHGRTLGGGI